MTDPAPNVWHIPLMLPREAFSPRDAARAGDLWRTFQQAAVQGSGKVGWPPHRYRELGSAFVVREMRVLHHREAGYGENIWAHTWIGQFRRGLLATRHIDIMGDQGPLCSASQEWAHVSSTLRPTRAPKELVDAFCVVEGRRDAIQLPAIVHADQGPVHQFAFTCWHTWMDPLGHANHPVYVDWCDEAISMAMAGVGLNPIALGPVAERVKWKKGVVAGARVVIHTQRTGRTETGGVVFEHVLKAPDDSVYAMATTVRRMAGDGTEALAQV